MANENGQTSALAKPPEKVPVQVPMVNGSLVPKDLEGMWRVASLFHSGKMLPAGVTSPEQVCIALMAGMEIGLTPTQAIQNVMVVNNRPTIWGDAAIGLVWASEKMESHDEGVEGAGDTRTAFCTVKRKGDAQPYTIKFSVNDAKAAGLWGKNGPWKQYPDRMLKLRARAFALRDKFADVLKGIGIREEVEDYQPDPRVAVSATLDAPPPEVRPSLMDRIDAAAKPSEPVVETPAEPTKPVSKGDANAEPVFDVHGNIIE